MRSLILLLFCGIGLLTVHGCKDDPAQGQPALTGRWNLIGASRNQKPTETLSGTYFFFQNNGTMQTNLPVGTEDAVPFVVREQTIEQKLPQPVKYQILRLTDSVLVLQMELRGVQFEMHLQKQFPGAEAPDDSLPEQETPPLSNDDGGDD